MGSCCIGVVQLCGSFGGLRYVMTVTLDVVWVGWVTVFYRDGQMKPREAFEASS